MWVPAPVVPFPAYRGSADARTLCEYLNGYALRFALTLCHGPVVVHGKRDRILIYSAESFDLPIQTSLAVQARLSRRCLTAWLGRRVSELSAHAVEEVKSYYMLWLPGMNQSLQRENVHGLLDWKRLKKKPRSFPAVICHVRPVKWQPALWLIPTFSRRLRLSSAFQSHSTSALSDKQVITVSFKRVPV